MNHKVEKGKGHLPEQEKHFQAIFDQAAVGVILVESTTGKYLRANKKYCDIVGYSEEELRNIDFQSITHPDDHGADSEFMESLISGKIREFSRDKRYIRSNGDVVWVNGTVSAMWEPGERPSYHITVIQDITKRIQAEELLRKSEEKYRTLVENIPDYVMRYDRQHRHIFANSRTLQANNMTAGEFFGKTHRELGFDPHLTDRWEKTIDKVFETGQPQVEVFEWEDASGAKMILEWGVYPEYASDGSFETLVGFGRDITERKQAEQERIRLLAREHEARSEAEAARRLNRMKSMFISSISHELRTPLNSIIGFTSLILDGTSGELNPDQKEQLTIVHSSGKHLLALINDILDLSQIEEGKLRVAVSEFDLAQVINEAVSYLNISLNEKKLELKIDVRYIKMKTDRMRMLQCIMNLLSNAIKYTENGSIEITANVVYDNVEISVKDTGIGIKTWDIPKLFGPFVRLQSPLTIKTSGTGLGLYLVKKLAKDFLKGDIEVQSEFGKGSTFTLRIPIDLDKIV